MLGELRYIEADRTNAYLGSLMRDGWMHGKESETSGATKREVNIT